MQYKQAHEYAHVKCNQSKFMSLLSLLVCFSCLRILILLLSSMLLPLCLCPTSTSLFQSLSKLSYIISPSCTISIWKLSYLCTISPPLSLISIKGVLLFDAKVCIWDRWLRLESCIFYGHHLIIGMTPLVDTTCNLYHLYLIILCMGHPFYTLELL